MFDNDLAVHMIVRTDCAGLTAGRLFLTIMYRVFCPSELKHGESEPALR